MDSAAPVTAPQLVPAASRGLLGPLHWLALLTIVLLAAAVRFHQLEASAPHYDELWHLECSTARGSPHEQLAEDRLALAPAVTSLRGAGPWWSIWNRMD